MQAVQAKPHNLQKCFREVHNIELKHRSAKSIQVRYYRVLINPEHPKYKGSLFILVSTKSSCSNTKIYYDDFKHEVSPHEVSIFTRILKLLKIKW